MVGVVEDINDPKKIGRVKVRIERLHGRKDDLTVADIWAFERKKKFYTDALEDKLKKEIYAKMFSNSIFRKAIDDPRVCNTTTKFNYKEIKRFLDGRLS